MAATKGSYGGFGLLAASSVRARLASLVGFRGNWFEARCGAEPGRGEIYLTKKDIDALQSNNNYTLIMGTSENVVTFPNVYMVKASRVFTTGYENDDSALYLVELADVRIVVAMSFIDKQYNIRTPSSDDGDVNAFDDYLRRTADADGDPWTFDTMWEDIWSNMPVTAGVKPELPGTGGSGRPENMRYVTQSALTAAADVAARLSLNFFYDPIDGIFDLAVAGGTDTYYDQLSAQCAPRKEGSRATRFPANRVTIPETVKVCYRVFYTDQSMDDIIEHPMHVMEYSLADYNAANGTSLQAAAVGTVEILYDDLDAIWKENAETTDPSENQTELEARTEERATEFYRAISGMRPHVETYNGAWPFVPGELVTRVLWQDVGGGFKTSVFFEGPPRWGERELRLPRGGGVKVFGPCGTFTPDEEAEDTDFEVVGPGGCLFPSRVGIAIRNLSTGVTTTKAAELVDSDPASFTYRTDAFTHTCKSGDITIYVEIIVYGTGISNWMVSTDDPSLFGGIVATTYIDGSDTFVASHRNTIFSMYSDQFGKLQIGPAGAPCDCGTIPDDFCILMPTR